MRRTDLPDSPRRRLLLSAAIAGPLLLTPAARAADGDGDGGHRGTLRLGFTGVVARSDAETLARFVDYLESRTGYAFEPVFTRTYREMAERLAGGAVDVAYICGSSYILLQERHDPRLLAAPLIGDRPVYYSLVVVRADSPYRSLEDLRGKPYAFSDRQSNSGTLVPTYELNRQGESATSFFHPLIHVNNHAETINALLAGLVEGTSIGSHAYRHMLSALPALEDRLRVVERLGPYPSTPLVARRDLDHGIAAAVRKALIGMADDPEGAEILRQFGIDGYGTISRAAYEPIREVVRETLGYNDVR